MYKDESKNNRIFGYNQLNNQNSSLGINQSMSTNFLSPETINQQNVPVSMSISQSALQYSRTPNTIQHNANNSRSTEQVFMNNSQINYFNVDRNNQKQNIINRLKEKQ